MDGRCGCAVRGAGAGCRGACDRGEPYRAVLRGARPRRPACRARRPGSGCLGKGMLPARWPGGSRSSRSSPHRPGSGWTRALDPTRS